MQQQRVKGAKKDIRLRMVKGENIENNEIMASEACRLSREPSLAYYLKLNAVTVGYLDESI